MSNRLAGETSPYLLQHAHNPVDWYPWGEEALARARGLNRPIFLSVGYSACHWCHVMERESFEDPATAALMNELFVNIKVDREERPDLDAIYMDAVQVLSGQGGWPMSVFLTPEGRPFYGGTYYPPEPRYGMPAFRQLLQSVAEAWRSRPEQVAGQAARLTEMLNRSARIGAGSAAAAGGAGEIGAEILDAALEQLRQYFDEEEGGFGSQPKFPQPMTLDFCLAQYRRTGSLDALMMAELTLEKMAQGGIYDQLGGGFHRYSVDAVWLTPHFEKMLYDNAQLLRTYLHAWQLTQRPLFLQVVNQTIDYVLREMTQPGGGFYSAQDADSEGHEGKFFVWTAGELRALLTPAQAEAAAAWWGVSERGNFEGSNILHVTRSLEEVAARLQRTPAAVAQLLEEARAVLFAARSRRVAPARDEKVLAEWNGHMIHALAECGAALGRADALAAAEAAAAFVLTQMRRPAPDAAAGDQRLLRSYKDGRARFNAYLEDYAAMLRALIALYEATFNLYYLAEASRLAQTMLGEFHDATNSGFFQTGASHEQLVARRKDYIDNAIPSGNSMAADALQRLAVLVGNDRYRLEALRICLSMKEGMAQQPTGFGRLLCVLNSLLSPSQEVVIVGAPADPATQVLLETVRSRYLPTTVLAALDPDAPDAAGALLPLLEGRTLVDGQPAAFVCENYACRLPVTDPAALAALLA